MKKWILSLLALVSLWVPVKASSIPQPTEMFYVNDYAQVLSEETEKKIMQLNDRLYEDYEVQFVVLTVGYLEGMSIDDYAYEVFNDWGIGTSKYNRGILLLLAIGEEDYYVLPGDGLENVLSASVLNNLFRDYLEDDFANEHYDEGVQSFINAVDKKLKTSLNPLTTSTATKPNYVSGVGHFLIPLVIFLILIFILAIILQSGRSRRRVYRVPRRPRRPMAPPPPPPGYGPMMSRPRRSVWVSRPTSRRSSSSWHSSSHSTSRRSSSSSRPTRSSAPRSGGGGRSRGGGAGRH